MSTQASTQVELLEFQAIGGKIGAIVKGVKLGGDVPAEQVQAIRQALNKYKVLFFRGQNHLDDASQEAFAALLGAPFAHPTVPTKAGSQYILELDSHQGGRANAWHTDVTFIDAYPSASILRSIVVAESGGDTVWANTAAAYDSLPDVLKNLADRLWAVHSNAYDYANRSSSDFAQRASASTEQTAEAVKKYQSTFASTVYETEHPLVHVHPETGEKNLLLGSFVKKIIGVSTSESARLYDIFQEHVTRLEHSVRWRWAEGDVALWDNRATQHVAVNDYGNQHRVMRRVTLAGHLPVSVDGRNSVTRVKEPRKAE